MTALTVGSSPLSKQWVPQLVLDVTFACAALGGLAGDCLRARPKLLSTWFSIVGVSWSTLDATMMTADAVRAVQPVGRPASVLGSGEATERQSCSWLQRGAVYVACHFERDTSECLCE